VGSDWLSEKENKAVRLEHAEKHKRRVAHQSSTENMKRNARWGGPQKRGEMGK
jgi:hypothetical protein